jgi:hypothetical protein
MIEDICGQILFEVLVAIIVLALMESLGISQGQAHGVLILTILFAFFVFRKRIFASIEAKRVEAAEKAESEGGQPEDSNSPDNIEDVNTDSEIEIGEPWWENNGE